MKTTGAKKVLRAMHAELARNMKNLRVPGHPKPYYLSYLVRDIRNYNVFARYGSVFHEDSGHSRTCYTDCRVGSYRYDQVSRGGLHDNSEDVESYDLTELPLEDDENAIRFALWRLTDAKYREAVKSFHDRKSRDVSYLDPNKGLSSFSKAKAESNWDRLQTLDVDKAAWRQFVKKASASLTEYPNIKTSYVEFSSRLVTKLFLSSEGVEKVWQIPMFSVIAHLWMHTKSCDLDHSLTIHTPNLAELPDLKAFTKKIAERVALMRQIEDAHEMTSYSGPALLSAKAAGLLLHEVLGHRLEGSRLLSDEEGRTFKDKVGKVITHKDLNVSDDPSLRAFGNKGLVGSYSHDDEGCTAKPTALVRQGKLVSFLTTRAPIKGQRGSNGHARNESFERPISRMGNLLITTEKGHSWDELKALLIAEIEKRNLEFGIALLDVEGGETGTESYNFQAFLGEVTIAKKIYVDGREEFVRGVDFVGTPLSSLRNIIAVGKDYSVDNGYCGAESGTIPVSTVSPPLLLSNLELQAKDNLRLTQYVLPQPWFPVPKKKTKRSKT